MFADRRTLGAVLAVLAGVAWGAMAPTVKAILISSPLFGAFSLSLARGLWALPFLAIVAFVSRPRSTPFRRIDVVSFIAVALLAAFGLNLLFQVAIAKTSAAHAVLFQGLSPLALAALEAIVFRRPLDRQRTLGLAFGAGGIALLAFGRSSEGASLAGDAIMLGWLAIFAAYSLLIRALAERFSPIFASAFGWGLGFVLLSLSGAQLIPAAARDTFAVPLYAAGIIGVLSFLTGVCAPALHAMSLRMTSVAIVTAASQYASIATGVALSLFALHETLAPAGIAGAVLLLVSLTLTVVRFPVP
jgi:drug/metabolite transporter (DMT)-like permease